jgi:GAF domain-containing protein
MSNLSMDTLPKSWQSAPSAMEAEGIAAFLAVPVVVDGKAIGALVLYTAGPREFTKEDAAFLGALAAHSGIALDRARLIGQIRRSTRLFFDLSAGINSSLDVTEIMDILTVDLCKALKAKAVSVQLVDENSGDLRQVASYGLSEKFLSEGCRGDDPDILTALNGETVLTRDVSADTGGLYRNEKLEEGIATILTAPVKSRDDIIGTLQLYYGTLRDFYDDEITMVNALANQAGLAIQNATCYLALESDMKDLKDDIWSHRSWF